MLNILYFTFANSPEKPLASLREEDDALQQILLPGVLKRHYLVQRDQYAGLRGIVDNLQKFGDDLALFHYSGHANLSSLATENGATHIEGFSILLGRCRRLKIVVLNGCSTRGQVRQLLEAGVSLVVATSAAVGDEKATRFSIRFYEALAHMATYRQAFDLAAAEVQAMDGRLKVYRSQGLEQSHTDHEGTWGLYWAPGKESILDDTLPHQATGHFDDGFRPNERLLPALWNALLPYSDRMRVHSDVDSGDQSVLIINSLPMPVGEQVRKLLCPVNEENDGFDKENESRLRQLVRTWQVTMELLSFTMMTQLWEALLCKQDLKIPRESADVIRSFFHLTESERRHCDLLRIIGAILQALDGNDIEPFVDELQELRRLLNEDEGFKSAMLSMQLLHDQLLDGSVLPADVSTLCRHAEEALSDFFSDLGFLARYQIISIHGIDIEKYRHLLQPVFHHNIVSKRAFGTESRRTIEQAIPMDNRSVLLEKTGFTKGLINLSPFLIDANSFDKKADKLSLHYFAAFDPASQEYRYRHIHDARQWIPVSSSSYREVEPQLNYFLELLNQHRSDS